LDSSLPEVTVVYNTLSNSQLKSADFVYSSGNYKEYVYRVCEFAISKIETVDGDTLTINSLPSSLLSNIANEIIKTSTLSPEDMDKIETSLSVFFSEQLSSDTWKCDICKQKRLDNTRNCGFKQDAPHNPDFKIMVNKTIYTHCPIFDVDNNIISSGIEAYNVLKGRFLPDSGGWADQTQAFTILSVIVNNKIEERNKIQMDKMLKENKR
jgi:hypothetical protein